MNMFFFKVLKNKLSLRKTSMELESRLYWKVGVFWGSWD